MSALRWCIRQQLRTYQAGVTLPLWSIIKVKGIGPVLSSYEEAAAYIRRIKPKKDPS